MRWLALALALGAFGCGSPREARCATCGMLVAPDDGWRAGAEGLAFDAPKCLFRYVHRHGVPSEPWVIEYYAQARRDARAMLYVLGTDLESPMGSDLVPVEGREAAERMLADHRGQRILSFDEVSAAIVDPLFR